MNTRFLPASAWLVVVGAGAILFIGAFARFDTAATPSDSPPPPLAQEGSPAGLPAQAQSPANLSPGLSEIVKLAQAHVDEGVMLAYVKSSRRVFTPSADEILYLSDLGVSQDVIGALVSTALPAAAPAAPPPSSPAIAGEPIAPMTPPMAQGEPPPATIQPEAVSNPDMFYNNLAPYGSWMQQPDYGFVWQPTVETINPAWSPYLDGGQWMYSDSGWYWQSDYSWGWAVYHYGRWANLPGKGWVWAPGNVWGPAWVTWRSSGSYVGWAPLPPGANLNVLGQLTFNSKQTGSNGNFGLPATAYSVVNLSNLASRNLPRRVMAAAYVGEFVKSSVAIDNYSIVNNRIFNGGPSPEVVAAARHSPLSRATLRSVSTPEAAGLAKGMEIKTLNVYVPAVALAASASAGSSASDKSHSPTAEKSSSKDVTMLAENDAAGPGAAPMGSTSDELPVQLPPLRYSSASVPAGINRSRANVNISPLPEPALANRNWQAERSMAVVEHPSTPAPRLEGFNSPPRPAESPHLAVENHPAPVESPRAAPAPPSPAPAPASSSASSTKSGK